MYSGRIGELHLRANDGWNGWRIQKSRLGPFIHVRFNPSFDIQALISSRKEQKDFISVLFVSFSLKPCLQLLC